MLLDRRLSAVCAIGAATAAIAVSGCGGGNNNNKTNTSGGATTTTNTTASNTQTTTTSNAQYRAAVERVANTFKNDAQKASQQVASAPTKQGKIKGLEALKASVNKAADNFEGLNPPPNARKANQDLVNELRALGGDVNTVEQALKTNDASKAQSVLPKLQVDQSKIQATLQDLKKAVGG